MAYFVRFASIIRKRRLNGSDNDAKLQEVPLHQVLSPPLSFLPSAGSMFRTVERETDSIPARVDPAISLKSSRLFAAATACTDNHTNESRRLTTFL